MSVEWSIALQVFEVSNIKLTDPQGCHGKCSAENNQKCTERGKKGIKND